MGVIYLSVLALASSRIFLNADTWKYDEYYADDIFELLSWREKTLLCFDLYMSPRSVSRVPIDNAPALAQVTTWYWTEKIYEWIKQRYKNKYFLGPR